MVPCPPMSLARSDALRDALMHLEDADRQVAAILRRRRWGIFFHQIMPAENIEASAPDGFLPAALVLLAAFPAWMWWLAALIAALAAAVTFDLSLVPLAIAALVTAVVARLAITLAYPDDVLGPPDGTIDLTRTLGDAARSLHEARQAGCDVGWTGGDPAIADRPWRMLPAIHRTAAQVRVAQRALP